MLNKHAGAVRRIVLLSVIGGGLLAGGVQARGGENSPVFQIEVPQAQIAPTSQTNLDLVSGDVNLIVLHVLRPDADNIDYGQIYPSVNGAAASRISETRPGLDGKMVRIDLRTRPGFELLPGNNAIGIQATDRNGRVMGATFNLHTPAGACRGGGGRARILELTALGDLLHAGVNMDRLIQLVVECGVHFQPSVETDQKLQDLGAEPKLLAAIHNPAAPEFRDYQTDAVKLDQVLNLLRAHVPESKIIASMEDPGINFHVTPEVEEKLRSAGATQKLIESARYMSGARLSAADTKALSLSQILHLLEGGAVPKERVFALVQQHGVSFRLDRATQDRLHDAGANEKLMQAIRNASNQYAMTH